MKQISVRISALFYSSIKTRANLHPVKFKGLQIPSLQTCPSMGPAATNTHQRDAKPAPQDYTDPYMPRAGRWSLPWRWWQRKNNRVNRFMTWYGRRTQKTVTATHGRCRMSVPQGMHRFFSSKPQPFSDPGISPNEQPRCNSVCSLLSNPSIMTSLPTQHINPAETGVFHHA